MAYDFTFGKKPTPADFGLPPPVGLPPYGPKYAPYEDALLKWEQKQVSMQGVTDKTVTSGAAYEAKTNSPSWQKAVKDYNAGVPQTDEGFNRLLSKLNNYYTGGEASSGRLVPELAAQAIERWGIDAQPSPGYQFMDNVIVPLATTALLGGAAYAAIPGMFGGAAGGADAAAADMAAGMGGVPGSAAFLTPEAYTTAMGNWAGADAASAAAAGGAGNSWWDKISSFFPPGTTPASAASTASKTPGLLDRIAKTFGISPSSLGSLLSTGTGMLGSYLSGRSATDAAQISANAQIEAARIAAEASKFKPVGVTTRFGQSQFGYDAQGNLTSAGYNLSPEAKAQQNALMGMSNQMLTQYQGAPAAAAPMGTAAQTMFGLGQGYLQTSPQAQAQQYMQQQQDLLAGSRYTDYANIQNKLQNQGRGGLAIGGGGGMLAANPEMNAYYNALTQQNLQLAANATQGGQQNAQFGAGMVGTGGQMLRGMYDTQNAAYSPYQTALGGATSLEALGQQPMDLGTAIGAKTSTAAAQAGLFRGQGMMNAAQTMQPANAYNPWVAPLAGASKFFSNWGQ